MKQRVRLFGVLSAAVLALVATSASVANADSGEIDIDKAVIGGAPTERWVDDDGYERLPLNELEAIAQAQTAAQIAEVIDSGEPYNALIDGETGEIRAAVPAVKVALPIAPMAITTGCGVPGHATASQMVGGRGLAWCFNGSGSAPLSLGNVYYVAAGDRTTLWTYNGGPQYVTGTGTSHTFSPMVSLNSIQR